jgi:hypothetical protein
MRLPSENVSLTTMTSTSTSFLAEHSSDASWLHSAVFVTRHDDRNSRFGGQLRAAEQIFNKGGNPRRVGVQDI